MEHVTTFVICQKNKIGDSLEIVENFSSYSNSAFRTSPNGRFIFTTAFHGGHFKNQSAWSGSHSIRFPLRGLISIMLRGFASVSKAT